MKKTLLAASLISLLYVSCDKAEEKPSGESQTFLKEGDKVAVIATSYYKEESLQYDFAIAEFESRGLTVLTGANVFGKYPDKGIGNNYAGSPQQRADDLRTALQDQSVKAIISMSGGEGAIQLSDLISNDELKAHPKFFVGYDDFTILHSKAAMSGIKTIYGADMSRIGTSPGAEYVQSLISLLFGTIPSYTITPSKYNSIGNASGILLGGNMETIRALCGTSHNILNCKDIILFIEAQESSFSQIDGMLNTLKLQAGFSNVKGLIIGVFPKCSANMNYSSVEDMVYKEFSSKLGIPVCFNFPCGHKGDLTPLLLGAKVKLDVETNSVSLQYL